MKLLVTGGAGFIGSCFVRHWVCKYPKDMVINLDKLTYAGNLENLQDIEEATNYQFIKGDICDRKLVESICKRVDTIVHFAAETHVDRSIMDSSEFLKTNIIGTNVLLTSALKSKIKRFHHVSTDEVFGSLALGSKDKFDEHTPYDPRNPYSASKAASDHLVRAYYETYKLPMTISNCSNNYGPYCFPEKLFSLAITNILEGKKVPVYGDGLNVRDWLYVEDHIQAIETILQKGAIGETYIIGGLTDDISNIEVIKKILKLMNAQESMIEYVKDRPGHDRRYAMDWTKINTELGWSPQVSIEEGLKKTIDWYRNNRKWWENIKSGEYTDYYKKQYDKVD